MTVEEKLDALLEEQKKIQAELEALRRELAAIPRGYLIPYPVPQYPMPYPWEGPWAITSCSDYP
jgi:alpha-D-ribose 1-methylphosphonate 5-phosphate C-P lyase